MASDIVGNLDDLSTTHSAHTETGGTNTQSPPTPRPENHSTLPDITDIEVTVIDIYTLSTSVKLSRVNDKTTSVALASLGFIGNTPFNPSVAVSMKTLELYRLLRRRKASFSVEGFVKVICDLYTVSCPYSSLYFHSLVDQVPYCRRYRRLFGDAFDVYLEVIRVVDNRMKAALSCDSPNWRVLNACPACTYEVCRCGFYCFSPPTASIA